MKLSGFIVLLVLMTSSCVKKEFTESLSFPAVVEDKTITHLVVDVDAADVIIEVSKDNTSSVKADIEYRGREPDHKVVVDGSTMRLTMECHMSCSGQYFLTVPAQVASDIRLGAGNVEIADLTGDVAITTGAGNVLLSRVSGELDIRSGAGNIEGVDCQSTRYRVKTGAGNISLNARTAPLDASLKSGVGNVRFYVPASRYQLAVSSGMGTERISGIITDNSSANIIRARSGVGNVTVEGI